MLLRSLSLIARVFFGAASVCELDASSCSKELTGVIYVLGLKSSANMSDKGTVSPKEKEATEKRGRGRPRKQPQVKASDVSTANLFFYLFGGEESVLL